MLQADCAYQYAPEDGMLAWALASGYSKPSKVFNQFSLKVIV